MVNAKETCKAFAIRVGISQTLLKSLNPTLSCSARFPSNLQLCTAGIFPANYTPATTSTVACGQTYTTQVTDTCDTVASQWNISAATLKR